MPNEKPKTRIRTLSSPTERLEVPTSLPNPPSEPEDRPRRRATFSSNVMPSLGGIFGKKKDVPHSLDSSIGTNPGEEPPPSTTPTVRSSISEMIRSSITENHITSPLSLTTNPINMLQRKLSHKALKKAGSISDLMKMSKEAMKTPTTIVVDKLNSLQKAVYLDDEAKVKKLIMEKDRDVNKMDSYHKCTALHIAAEFNKLSMVKILLDPMSQLGYKSGNSWGSFAKKMGNPNCSNAEGRSPFILAVKAGHVDIARLLLDNNASINAVDASGWGALHYTIIGDDWEMFDLLIGRGIRLHVVDKSGNTLLHHCIRLGKEKMALAFISYGHSLSVKNWEGQTPLHMAVKKGQEKVVKALLTEKCDVLIQDIYDKFAKDYIQTPLVLSRETVLLLNPKYKFDDETMAKEGNQPIQMIKSTVESQPAIVTSPQTGKPNVEKIVGISRSSSFEEEPVFKSATAVPSVKEKLTEAAPSKSLHTGRPELDNISKTPPSNKQKIVSKSAISDPSVKEKVTESAPPKSTKTGRPKLEERVSISKTPSSNVLNEKNLVFKSDTAISSVNEKVIEATPPKSPHTGRPKLDSISNIFNEKKLISKSTTALHSAKEKVIEAPYSKSVESLSIAIHSSLQKPNSIQIAKKLRISEISNSSKIPISRSFPSQVALENKSSVPNNNSQKSIESDLPAVNVPAINVETESVEDIFSTPIESFVIVDPPHIESTIEEDVSDPIELSASSKSEHLLDISNVCPPMELFERNDEDSDEPLAVSNISSQSSKESIKKSSRHSDTSGFSSGADDISAEFIPLKKDDGGKSKHDFRSSDKLDENSLLSSIPDTDPPKEESQMSDSDSLLKLSDEESKLNTAEKDNTTDSVISVSSMEPSLSSSPESKTMLKKWRSVSLDSIDRLATIESRSEISESSVLWSHINLNSDIQQMFNKISSENPPSKDSILELESLVNKQFKANAEIAEKTKGQDLESLIKDLEQKNRQIDKLKEILASQQHQYDALFEKNKMLVNNIRLQETTTPDQQELLLKNDNLVRVLQANDKTHKQNNELLTKVEALKSQLKLRNDEYSLKLLSLKSKNDLIKVMEKEIAGLKQKYEIPASLFEQNEKMKNEIKDILEKNKETEDKLNANISKLKDEHRIELNKLQRKLDDAVSRASTLQETANASSNQKILEENEREKKELTATLAREKRHHIEEMDQMRVRIRDLELANKAKEENSIKVEKELKNIRDQIVITLGEGEVTSAQSCEEVFQHLMKKQLQNTTHQSTNKYDNQGPEDAKIKELESIIEQTKKNGEKREGALKEKFQQALKEKTLQITELNLTITDLKTNVNDLRSEVATAQQKALEVSEAAKVHDQSNELNKAVDLMKILEEKDLELKQVKSNYMKLEDKFDLVTKDLRSSNTEKEKLLKEITRKHNEEIEQNKIENSVTFKKLALELKEAQEVNEKLTFDLNCAAKDIETLQLKTDNQGPEDVKVKELESIIEQTKKNAEKREGALKEKFQQALKEKTLQITELNLTITDLKTNVNDLRNEVATIQQRTLENNEAALDKLQDQFNESNKEVELMKLLDEKDLKLKEVNSNYMKLQDKFALLTQELRLSNMEKEKLLKEIGKNPTGQIEQNKIENSATFKKLALEPKEAQEVLAFKDGETLFRTPLKTDSQELNELELIIEQNEKNGEKGGGALKEKFRQTLKEKTLQITELNLTITDLRAIVNDLRNEVANIQKKTLENNEATLEKIQDQFNELNKEAELRKLLEEKELKLKELKSSYQDKFDLLTEDLRSSNIEKEKLLKEISRKHEQIEKTKIDDSAFKKLASELKESQEVNKKLTFDWNCAFRDWETKRERLLSENQSLFNEFKESEFARVSLTTEIQALKLKLNDSTIVKEFEACQKQLVECRETIEELKRKAAPPSVPSQNDQSIRDLKSQNKLLRGGLAYLESIEHPVINTADTLRELEGKVFALNNQLQQKDFEIQKMAFNISCLSDSVAKKNDKIESLQDSIISQQKVQHKVPENQQNPSSDMLFSEYKAKQTMHMQSLQENHELKVQIRKLKKHHIQMRNELEDKLKKLVGELKAQSLERIKIERKKETQHGKLLLGYEKEIASLSGEILELKKVFVKK